jgi:hypothetical protein
LTGVSVTLAGLGSERSVQLPVRKGDYVQIEAVDVDVREHPGPAQQADRLEIDEQAPHAHDRGSVAFGQAQLVGLEGEQKRVDPDLADARLALQAVAGVFGHVALHEPGQQQEPEQAVGNEQSRADEEPPVAQDAGQGLFHIDGL